MLLGETIRNTRQQECSEPQTARQTPRVGAHVAWVAVCAAGQGTSTTRTHCGPEAKKQRGLRLELRRGAATNSYVLESLARRETVEAGRLFVQRKVRERKEEQI